MNAGGIRELHWHAIAAEWAFVIKGRVRTTVIGPDGTSETNDFDPGDVWYFPRGHGHMLQGLGRARATSFSSSTMVPFRVRYVQQHRLAGAYAARGALEGTWVTGFGLREIPKEELYIVQGRIPPTKYRFHQGGQKIAHKSHRYPLMAQLPHSHSPAVKSGV